MLNISYKTFENNFLSLYNNNIYDEIYPKVQYTKYKLHHFGYDFVHKVDSETILSKVRYELKNEKSNFIKHLIIINVLFDNNKFLEILDNYNISINELVKKFDKAYLLEKLTNKKAENEDINSFFEIMTRYYGIKSNNVYILKLYELKALKDLENKKIK